VESQFYRLLQNRNMFYCWRSFHCEVYW